MNNLMLDIIANKREEIVKAKAKISELELRSTAASLPAPRDFKKALTGTTPRIIAECKRMSPSRGILAANYNPVDLAQKYERGGAAAISVLTDQKYFGGSLSDLTAVKAAVNIPVLRKDFVIDPYQVYEARAAGADTFLLIAGTVTYPQLEELITLGRSLGMEPLIESHTESELLEILKGSGCIVGINNRNLNNFAVDLDHARRLVSHFLGKTPNITGICESGVKTRKDIENMSAVGYNVFLIGEALVTNPDPEAGIKSLIYPS